MSASTRVRTLTAGLLAAVLLASAAAARAQDGGDDRWAFTTLYTYSGVSGDRGDWNEVELDLLYKVRPRVLLGANLDWRERFDRDDILYTGSLSVQATDALEWHVAATATPDADFSPERIYAAGFEWRPWQRASLLLDYRRLELADGGHLREWRPGAILWFSDQTWLTARYTDGDAYDGTGYHGHALRLDHVFAGRQRLTLGYAHGIDPERDPALPGVLLTEADYWSAYYRMPLRPALDLVVGAEYEDRRRIYSRTGVSVGLVARF